MALNVLNIAHNKIYSLMDGEFLTQSANYHALAHLTLPSVTVQVVGEDTNHEGWSNDILNRHEIVISIHVHSSFIGFARNNPSTRANIDRVVEVLKANVDLGDNYRVLEVKVTSMDAEFDDSKTRGGEVLATILKVQRHTQV